MLYSIALCLPPAKIYPSPYSSLPHSRIMAALTSMTRVTAWALKPGRRSKGIKRLSILITLLHPISMPLNYHVHIVIRFHDGKLGGPATGRGATRASMDGWEPIAELTIIERVVVGVFRLWHWNCWVVIWFLIGVSALIFLLGMFGTLERFEGWRTGR